MLSVFRHCRAFRAQPPNGVLLNKPFRCAPLRAYTQLACNKPLTPLLKAPNWLKNGGTLAIRFTANKPEKGKKAIGSWLMVCSTMVFGAVALGIIGGYYYVLMSICTIADEIIKRATR